MPNKKALLVAIDNYEDPRNNLNSCIADARAMAEILEAQYGFTSIAMLLDGEATVEAVDAALDELLRGATPEDRLVFFYSGHGYRYQKGERRIEVLVMHNAQFFEDFRLSQKTQGLPDGVLTVITDCCHAGGLEKFLIAGPRGFDLAQPKVWNPPIEEVRRENMELARAERIVFKGFGREPTALPIAVAKEFGYPEPPAAVKSLVLAASRVDDGFGVATTEAGRAPMVPAAIQPGLDPAMAKALVLGPGAGARELAAQPDRGAPGGVEVVTALDDIAVVAAGTRAAEPGAVKVLEGPGSDVSAGLTGKALPGQLQIKAVLLAASLAHETASAKTNDTEGLSAFTFGIRKVLRENGFDLPPSEFMPRVAATLHSMGFRQTPILHEPQELQLKLGTLPFILMPRGSGAGSGALAGGGEAAGGAADTGASLTRDTGGEDTTMAGEYERVGGAAGAEGAMTEAEGAADMGAEMPEAGIRLSDEQVKGLFDSLIRIAPTVVGAIASALSKSIAAGPGVTEKGIEETAVVMTGDQVKGFLSSVIRHGPRVVRAVIDALSKGTPVAAVAGVEPRFIPPEEGEVTMTAGELKGLFSFVRRVARRAAPVVRAVAGGVLNALAKELPADAAAKGEAEDTEAITLTEGQAKGLFDLVRLVLSQIPRGKGLEEAEVAEPEMTPAEAKGWLQLLSLVPDLAMQAVEALGKGAEMGSAPEAAPKGLTVPGEAGMEAGERGAEATAVEAAGEMGAETPGAAIALPGEQVDKLFGLLAAIAPTVIGAVASALRKSLAAGPGAAVKGLEDEGAIVITSDQVKGLLSSVLRHGPRVIRAVMDALSKGTPLTTEPGGKDFQPEQAEIAMTAGELKGLFSFVRRVARRAAPVVRAVAGGVLNALSKELPADAAAKGETEDTEAVTLTEGQAKGLFDLVRLVLSQIPRGKALEEAEVAEPELTPAEAKGWLQLLSLVPDLAMQAAEALGKGAEMETPTPEAAAKSLTTLGEPGMEAGEMGDDAGDAAIAISGEQMDKLFGLLARFAPRVIGAVASALSKAIATGEGAAKGVGGAEIVMSSEQVERFLQEVSSEAPEAMDAVLDELSKGQILMPGGAAPAEEEAITVPVSELKGIRSFFRRIGRGVRRVGGAILDALTKELPGAPKGEEATVTLTASEVKGLLSEMEEMLASPPEADAKALEEEEAPEMTTEQAKTYLRLRGRLGAGHPFLQYLRGRGARGSITRTAPSPAAPTPTGAGKGLTVTETAAPETAAPGTAAPEAAAPGDVPETVSEEAGEKAWVAEALRAAGVEGTEEK